MRVLSVYPVRPSRQLMNNRHCGSILWILNQWHWERALANTYGSPGWAAGWGGVENTTPSVSPGWKKKKKQATSIDASHFCAGVFSSPAMTNRLFVQYWRFVQRGSYEGASFSSGSCISMGPSLGCGGLILKKICQFLNPVAVRAHSMQFYCLLMDLPFALWFSVFTI